MNQVKWEPDLKFINGTRFLLAIWVVLGHFYTLIGGAAVFKLPKHLLFISNPLIAVYGFMVITGFLMAYTSTIRENIEPYESKSTIWKFWIRRIFRLYPVYFVALTFSYIAFTWIARNDAANLVGLTGTSILTNGVVRSIVAPAFWVYLCHIVLLHGFIPSIQDSILGVDWSLSLEMQFYAIFPFLFACLFGKLRSVGNKGLLIVFLSSVIIAKLSLNILGTWMKPGLMASYNLPSVLPYAMQLFFIGIIIARVVTNKLHHSVLVTAIVMMTPFQSTLTTITIFFFCVLMFSSGIQQHIHPLLYAFLTTCKNILGGKLAEFGANISYSLYLTHCMIISISISIAIQVAHRFDFGRIATIEVAFGIFVVASGTICAGLYQFIERPFIILGKRITRSM
jgi:peptidoglycan/LPS O-acetylase OafA/YrhL